MTELVDVSDLKSEADRRVGSTPTWGTIIMQFITNYQLALEAHNRLIGLPRTIVHNLKLFEIENEFDKPKLVRRFTPRGAVYKCIHCGCTDSTKFYFDRKTVCKPCKNRIQTVQRTAARRKKKLEKLEAKLNDLEKA